MLLEGSNLMCMRSHFLRNITPLLVDTCVLLRKKIKHHCQIPYYVLPLILRPLKKQKLRRNLLLRLPLLLLLRLLLPLLLLLVLLLLNPLLSSLSLEMHDFLFHQSFSVPFIDLVWAGCGFDSGVILKLPVALKLFFLFFDRKKLGKTDVFRRNPPLSTLLLLTIFFLLSLFFTFLLLFLVFCFFAFLSLVVSLTSFCSSGRSISFCFSVICFCSTISFKDNS
uniref:Uncharacterized protein n=1 Tax=Opuntia streptacantha TaxID=393608 RepID=A0A7C9FN62_OPUST